MSAQPSLALVRAFVPRPAPPATTPELVVAAHAILNQGLDLLVHLENAQYGRIAAAPLAASIGQHYRHIVEHFQAVIWGIPSAEINYDARKRNPRIETEVGYASVVTCEILRALGRLAQADLDERCEVIATFGYASGAPSRLLSNFAREIADCSAHAIHHYAIIRLICAELGVAVSPEFGFAPSTLNYLSDRAAD